MSRFLTSGHFFCLLQQLLLSWLLKMSNPLVTINLVVLNGEKYIRHCLEAILVQSYPHELIEFNILDNGSTDKTREIIRDLEFRMSNLLGEGSRGGTSTGIASGFAKFNF